MHVSCPPAPTGPANRLGYVRRRQVTGPGDGPGSSDRARGTKGSTCDEQAGTCPKEARDEQSIGRTPSGFPPYSRAADIRELRYQGTGDQIVPGIDVRSLTKAFGATVAVDGISFEVPEGGFTTLLGPSGCGKTTTLRILAGLERPDSGEVTIGSQVAVSPERGIFVPAERRNVGVVFQSYALWPHMTVFDQVAYPLRVRRDRARLRERVLEVIELVDLGSQASRYPSQLSGGQQQRVALARALVFGPSVLLLDEPLSNLDAELRAQVRTELGRVHKETGVTWVYVTHDQSEALALSDHILVMSHGQIIESGPPHDIYDRPSTVYGAQFVGAANCLTGKLAAVARNHVVVELDTGDTVRAVAEDVTSSDVGKKATVIIRAEDVLIGVDGPGDANELVGDVRQVTYLGSHKQLVISVGTEMLAVNASKDLRELLNTKVTLRVPVERVRAILESRVPGHVSDDPAAVESGQAGIAL
jgi:iron(III) transport system ATP-binding protein